MKVNVVYAHPAADSYQASLHQRILRTLRARGDEVIDFDLYAMQFNPTMEEKEWRGHDEPSRPPPEDLNVYIDALKWAEACIFCFPTWWLGMPAILKGQSELRQMGFRALAFVRHTAQQSIAVRSCIPL